MQVITIETIEAQNIDENFLIKRYPLDLTSLPTICEAKPGSGTIRLARTGKGSVSKSLKIDEVHPPKLQSLIEKAYNSARVAANSK